MQRVGQRVGSGLDIDAKLDHRGRVAKIRSGWRVCASPFVMNDCFIHRPGESKTSPAPFHVIYALQRTVPHVTLAASTAAFPPTMQPARQPPWSLSLGSFGARNMGPLKRILFLVGAMIGLAGCFWESSPPDLTDKDKPLKLVVIWDRVISSETIERSTWSSTDEEQLVKLTRLMDTKSWKSASTLLAGHSTRIIFTTKSGKIWEVSQRRGESNSLSMFNRHDRGWSGWFLGSREFLQELTSMIEAETGFSVDLTTEYRNAIKSGAQKKVVPIATQEQLKKYPGYPELIWNGDKREFEFAD